jgi:hypothetical protein
MKVKELIEKLQQFPEDMDVFTVGEEYEGNELSHFAYNPNPEIKRFITDDDGDSFIVQRACLKTAEAKKCLVL